MPTRQFLHKFLHKQLPQNPQNTKTKPHHATRSPTPQSFPIHIRKAQPQTFNAAYPCKFG